MKSMKKNWIVLLMLIAILVALGVGTITSHGIAADVDYANMYRVDNGIYDQYTNSTTHGQYTLAYYAENHYASMASVEYGEVNAETMQYGYIYTIEGDDPITQFVPRELFLSETEEPVLYIGREYGFLVDTFFPEIALVSGDTLVSDNPHSTVMLFTVDAQDDMVSTGDHLTLTVAPIFQAEFAYVERTADSLFVINELPELSDTAEKADFLNYWYNDLLSHFSFPAGGADGYVVPVASGLEYEFAEYTKYYLTDIGCTMSLYNVNHPNADDDGNHRQPPKTTCQIRKYCKQI